MYRYARTIIAIFALAGFGSLLLVWLALVYLVLMKT